MLNARENIKHFAKSLFATFLGLLMALALESWHQERYQRNLAQGALASVLREAEADRKALRDLGAANKDLPGNLGNFIALLESFRDARARHRPWKPVESSMNLSINHSAGNLKSSAWTMALANQSVQRFPRAQAEELADFYQQLGRFQAFLDQPVDYSPVAALGEIGSTETLKLRLERLGDGELERMVWNLRQLKVRFDMIRMWSEGMARRVEDGKASGQPKAAS